VKEVLLSFRPADLIFKSIHGPCPPFPIPTRFCQDFLALFEAPRPKRAGLPGKVVSFYIVPLVPVLKDEACGARAGRGQESYSFFSPMQAGLIIRERSCMKRVSRYSRPSESSGICWTW
jgi:hypothetical protein